MFVGDAAFGTLLIVSLGLVALVILCVISDLLITPLLTKLNKRRDSR